MKTRCFKRYEMDLEAENESVLTDIFSVPCVPPFKSFLTLLLPGFKWPAFVSFLAESASVLPPVSSRILRIRRRSLTSRQIPNFGTKSTSYFTTPNSFVEIRIGRGSRNERGEWERGTSKREGGEEGEEKDEKERRYIIEKLCRYLPPYIYLQIFYERKSYYLGFNAYAYILLVGISRY